MPDARQGRHGGGRGVGFGILRSHDERPGPGVWLTEIPGCAVDQPSSDRYVPAFNIPPVIVAIVGIFVVVHLYRLSLDQAGDIRFLLSFAFVPGRYAVTEGLPIGGFPGGSAAKVWSFLTYSLIHGDWTHLAMNSLWMLAFGSVVARRLGAVLFVAFSLVCAAAGAAVMLAAFWNQMFPVIGASAAVSGQLAAAFRLMYGGGSIVRPASVIAVLGDPRALIFMGVWVAINLVFGLGAVGLDDGGAKIAWEAHLGGFAAGFALFGVFDRFGPRRARVDIT